MNINANSVKFYFRTTSADDSDVRNLQIALCKELNAEVHIVDFDRYTRKFALSIYFSEERDIYVEYARMINYQAINEIIEETGVQIVYEDCRYLESCEVA